VGGGGGQANSAHVLRDGRCIEEVGLVQGDRPKNNVNTEQGATVGSKSHGKGTGDHLSTVRGGRKRATYQQNRTGSEKEGSVEWGVPKSGTGEGGGFTFCNT